MKPAVVLVATIAAAAVAGIAISFAQRPPAPGHGSSSPATSGVTAPVTNQPAVAFGFSLAADLATRQLVLFGGVDDFSETWLWDGTAWARAHPSLSPPGRFGASAAFDPQVGDVLLFGGTLEAGPNADDTWAWNGTTWLELDPGQGGPPGGGGSAMAWDPSRNEMVLVTRALDGTGGNETWIWGGTRWVRDVAGSLAAGDAGMLVAFDPQSDSLVAEGCCQSLPKQGAAEFPSTWRWNGSTWTPIATTTHPEDGSSLAADPSLGRLVLCGCDLSGGLPPEMWVWTGKNWVEGPYPQPPIAPEAEIADPADARFLVLGSASAGVDALAQTVQVWTLRGTAWLQLDAEPR